MSTITAVILIGSAHQNHGGIQPTHQLLLSENSRPAWMLSDLRSTATQTIWTPTVDDMLQDGLLMVGLFAVKDAQLTAEAAAFRKSLSQRVELHDDISAADRRRLHALTRTLGPETKLVLTLLRGSSIAGQLPILKHYRFAVEVCPSTYFREYSAWSQMVEEGGQLP